MLDVHRGHVPSRHPAEPGGGQRQFLRPLQHDHVDRRLAQLLRASTSTTLAGQSQVLARPRPNGPRSAVTGTR